MSRLSALLGCAAVLAVGCATAIGCAGARDAAVRSLNAADAFADAAQEELDARYQAAHDACLALADVATVQPCYDAVRARHAPAMAAYRALRSAWLAAAALEGAAERGEEVDVVRLEIAVAAVVKAQADLERAIAEAGR